MHSSACWYLRIQHMFLPLLIYNSPEFSRGYLDRETPSFLVEVCAAPSATITACPNGNFFERPLANYSGVI